MAVSVVITSFPLSVSVDPFNVNVTINGAKSGTNYLRLELYKDGTQNYFGETYTGQDWYGGSDGNKYFPIEISGASTSATLVGRIGNPSQTDYTGSGSYKLKIKRYTASGNASSGDDESQIALEINYNLATPTASPFKQQTISSPTLITPTPTPTRTPSPTTMFIATNSSVLADETMIPVQNTPNVATITPASHINNTSQSFPLFPAIIFALGIFFIGIAVWYNLVNVARPKKVR